MITLDKLYDMAEELGIEVDDFCFDRIRSISVPGHIGMDKSKMDDSSMEKTDLGHEMGHIGTNSFYTEGACREERETCEYRANKYAAETFLMPFEEVVDALADGDTEPWQIAQRFGVTEEFVRIVLQIYECRLRDAKVSALTKQNKDIEIVSDGVHGYNVVNTGMHITPGKSASHKDLRKAIDCIRRFEVMRDAENYY